MRNEDIVSDGDMANLKYFLVHLGHRSTDGEPRAVALLPCFLVSGKIQSSVKLAQEFARQNDDIIKILTAVETWGRDENRSGARYEVTLREYRRVRIYFPWQTSFSKTDEANYSRMR